MSESDKLRRQVATLATFGGHALRSGEIGELLQEATQLVSDAIGVDDTGPSAKREKKRPPVSGLLRVLCIFSTTKACCNNCTPPYHGSGQTNPSQCYD